jgi:hypothetical protein
MKTNIAARTGHASPDNDGGIVYADATPTTPLTHAESDYASVKGLNK